MVAFVDSFGCELKPEDQLNIAPTDPVPIIYPQGESFELQYARWWLTPRWSDGPSQTYAMFNARAENLESSQAFRDSFHNRRCIIPASSYVEWTGEGKDKHPVQISRKHQPLAFAGIWDVWNDELFSCSMVTTDAAPELEHIHNRMPVMLNGDGINRWLNLSAETNDLAYLFKGRLPYSLTSNNIEAKQMPRLL